MTGTQLPPVHVYAVETAIQMTLTELNENLREIYIEAYTQKEASDYIFRETAKELQQIFGPYLPSLTARVFTAWRSARPASCAATWRICAMRN